MRPAVRAWCRYTRTRRRTTTLPDVLMGREHGPRFRMPVSVTTTPLQLDWLPQHKWYPKAGMQLELMYSIPNRAEAAGRWPGGDGCKVAGCRVVGRRVSQALPDSDTRLAALQRRMSLTPCSPAPRTFRRMPSRRNPLAARCDCPCRPGRRACVQTGHPAFPVAAPRRGGHRAGCSARG